MLASIILDMPLARLRLAVAVLGLLSLLSTAWAIYALRLARRINDTPTSRIRSASQGHLELEGRGFLMPGPPIVSPLSGRSCVWWSYSIRRQVGDGDRRRWETLESGTSDELFLLKDLTGQVIVDPFGATVTPHTSVRWQDFSPRPGMIPARTPFFSFGEYEFTEKLIPIGLPLYVCGWFRTQSGGSELDLRRDVAARLADWKKDQRTLLHRFDRDRSGRIDAEEWEVAREAALREVLAEQAEPGRQDTDVVCKPPGREAFLISAIPQARLARRYRLAGLGVLLLSAAAASLLMYALHLRSA